MKPVSSPLSPLPGLPAGLRRQTGYGLFFIALPLCLLIFCAASPAYAQDPAHEGPLMIGVLDLEANNVDAGEASAITNRLRLSLSQTGVFSLIERANMDQLLQEVGFQLSGACDTDECIVQVGKILGARKMVAGSVSRVGTMYTLQIRLIDIETSAIDNEVVQDVFGGIEEVLTQATVSVARQLAALDPAVQVQQPGQQMTGGGGIASINVESDPAGATVTIDGDPKGTTPLQINVTAGSHEVVVEMDGYATQTRTMDVAGGTTKTESFTLPEIPSGFLNITSTPVGAEILIDDVSRGSTPVSRLRVSTGLHRIEVRMNGYDSIFQNIDITRGRRLSITAPLERSGQASIILNSNFNGARIFVDGELYNATTPVDNITLRPGPHTIEVKSRGYSSWSQTVDLVDGSRETYTANLNQKSRVGAFFLGAIFPGGGHFYSARSGMGTFMLLATAGAGAFALMQSQATLDAKDLYIEKREEYLRASTTSSAQQLHSQMQELHDDWSATQSSASTAVMLAIAVHAFGVVHSAVFMPRLRPVVSSGGPTLSLNAGSRAGRASLTLSINF